MRNALLALFALLVTSTAAMAQAPAAPAPEWGPAPAFLPTGARFAVLKGNPGEAGVYTLRLEMPDGYTVPPHWHPTDEHVTVISGKLRIGMGDVVDTTAVIMLGAGEFITAAAEGHHYAMAAGKTVVQVHGMGPFAITYVNPADDPRQEKTNP